MLDVAFVFTLLPHHVSSRKSTSCLSVRFPSPRVRGEVIKIRSRDALRARGLQTTTPQRSFRFAYRLIKREAERRKAHAVHCPRHTGRRHRLPMHGRGSAPNRGALAFRRSTAALVAATERCDSAQAVLHATERTQALPAPSAALKRSTPRAGRNAGGSDARTARERGYKPRPQEPHSPHPTAVTGRRP